MLKTKIKERKEARQLRRQGWSLSEIVEELNVAKSSVSNWVRDIQLTQKQQQRLDCKRTKFLIEGRRKGSQTNAKKHRKIRKQYQQQGRNEADFSNWLHVAGCMLYWAEGNKNKNAVGLSNMDVNLLKLFLRFLQECYNIEDDKIIICCQTATHTNRSVKEIEQYWLKVLGFSRKNLRKTVIVDKGDVKRKKYAKDYYGVCMIRVYNTEIAQRIYGSIKQYGNIQDDEKWLN